MNDALAQSPFETTPEPELQPSLEIRALHNLIGRYWNTVAPEDSRMTSANTPIILFLYKRQHEDIFQYDIERAFSITRSTASRVLSLMEKNGLIERTSVDWDARVRKITLTQKACDYVHDITRRARTLEETLLQGFTASQQEEILQALVRMKQNLLDSGLTHSEHTSDEHE